MLSRNKYIYTSCKITVTEMPLLARNKKFLCLYNVVEITALLETYLFHILNYTRYSLNTV